MTALEKQERLKAIGQELREMFLGCGPVGLTAYDYHVQVNLHRCGSYANGTKVLQELGFNKRSKVVVDDGNSPWVSVDGHTDDNKLYVSAFCQELPPTCKLVQEVVKVPRTETVVTEDFVEITRTRVVCGEETGSAELKPSVEFDDIPF